MKIIHHIVHQPFVFATGLAALLHSTWSLGTLFAGHQPPAGFTVDFIGWLVPAFLIAFALDVGQIVTSAEIRGGERSLMKYATFATFAVATYYLQWLYIAHHMPDLQLAGGVRPEWGAFATVMRDAAIWIIPALLPLSTLLYTFSGGHEQPAIAPVVVSEQPPEPVIVSEPVHTALPELAGPVIVPAQLAVIKHADNDIEVTCPSCGWDRGGYMSEESARRGLATHMARHCPAMHPDKKPALNGLHGE